MNDHHLREFLVSGAEEKDAFRDEIDRLYHASEEDVVAMLLEQARMEPTMAKRVNERAQSLVQAVVNATGNS